MKSYIQSVILFHYDSIESGALSWFKIYENISKPVSYEWNIVAYFQATS